MSTVEVLSRPKVSVIVPVYRTEATLARALDSVLRQSLQDFEVIVVDDGSPDGAGTIADQYAERDDRITVIHQPNRGAAEARRAGQCVARGKFLAHLDSDDTFTDNALEVLYTTAIHGNYDIVYPGHNRIIDGTIKSSAPRGIRGAVTPCEMLSLMLNQDFVYIGCLCFSRRELWADLLMTSTEVKRIPSEDLITNFNLVVRAQRIGLIDEPIYNYYMTAGSATMTGVLYSQELVHEFFNELEHIFAQAGLLEHYKPQIDEMKLHYVGFYVKNVDVADPWIGELMSIPRSRLRRKYKVLQALLPHNRLRRLAIVANRKLKQLLSR